MATSSATDGENSTPDDTECADSFVETDFTALECSQRWKINNFSLCWMKPGEKLDSPTFSSDADNRIAWCLSLYPTGINDDHKGNISVHLTLLRSYKTEIRVKFKFSILNHKGEASHLHENVIGATLLQHWDEHNPSCGADELVSRSFLMDTGNGLLPDDTLTIHCEVNAATIIPSAPTPSSNNILRADGWGYTEVNVVELTYLWTISNFTFCNEKNGEHIQSPSFSAITDASVKWRLILYPNGDREESKGGISIYLEPASDVDTELQASFGFCIVRAKTQKVTHSYPVNYTWSAEGERRGYGYTNLIKRDILLKKADELLPDNKLTIHCSVRYVADRVNTSGKAQPTKLQTPKRRRLNDDFEVLLTNEKLSDVALVVGGRELRAHKAILAARSPVFLAMFQHKPEEHSQGKVEVKDINYEVLKEMLLFIYTGTAKNIADMASALLAAADFYIIEDLKSKCEEELSSKVGIQNASAMLILADKYSATQLKTVAIDFINAHSTIVMNTQDFKKMAISHPQLIAAIGVKRLFDTKKK